MIEGIPRISVLVICYNQEKVISRAIESLLAQKEYLYEICVSDDCSKDKTWAILQEYSEKYPGLFVLNRNEPNIGIFENIEKTWGMPSGDIVYRLAGDDECGEGWFKTVIDYIQSKRIDYKNELFCIYGDYKVLYPNGDSFVFKNDAIAKGIDPMRLSIRGIIGNRSACFSRRIYDKYEKVSQGRSYLPESAQDRQLQLFTKKSYYIPYVGNIYYAQIGVNVSFNAKRLVERELVEDYAREFIEAHGYRFPSKDISYFKYKTELARSYRDRSIKHRLLVAGLFVKSFDISLVLKQIRIKRILFAIFRRLPHTKKLDWVV